MHPPQVVLQRVTMCKATFYYSIIIRILCQKKKKHSYMMSVIKIFRFYIKLPKYPEKIMQYPKPKL